MTKIAIISDTHDSLPWNIADNLAGVDVLFHAGDIRKQQILDDLADLVPEMHVVYGNNDDLSILGEELPRTLVVNIDGVEFAMGHEPLVAREAEIYADTMSCETVVINGHLHVPNISWENDMLVRICPGSLRDPRENYPRTIAYATVESGHIQDIHIETLGGSVLM